MSAVIVAGHGPSWALPMMGQWQCCPVIHSNGVLQEIGVLLVSLKRPLNSVTRAQNSLFQGSNSSTLGTTPSICDFVFSLLGSTPCHLESQALAANGSNVPPPPRQSMPSVESTATRGSLVQPLRWRQGTAARGGSRKPSWRVGLCQRMFPGGHATAALSTANSYPA